MVHKGERFPRGGPTIACPVTASCSEHPKSFYTATVRRQPYSTTGAIGCLAVQRGAIRPRIAYLVRQNRHCGHVASNVRFARKRPIRHRYSITSSARASRIGGISRPSTFAVLTLMTSSKRLLCSTGRSAGFDPLRVLSAYRARRYQFSAKLGA